MQPTIELFIGAPLKGGEASFLRQLYSDLGPHGRALIFANFEIAHGSTSAQIDFVVVTSKRAELLELKCLRGPVFGTENGPWKIEDPGGILVTYPGMNPWEQARDAKLALNDEMRLYQKREPNVRGPRKGRFFEFDARVCIYPTLHSRSKIIRGNFKAWVGSYEDALSALTTRVLPSSWGLEDWRRFAIEHLGLTSVSLNEAIDPAFNLARHRITEYLARLERTLAKELGPLLMASEGENCGESVVKKLLGDSNCMLLGRSGLGKTFHLQHVALRASMQREVPLLVEARYLTSQLAEALQRGIGPFTGIELGQLLDSIQKCGLSALLIVDGLTGNEPFVPALLKDIMAFQVRFGARVIVGSQKHFDLPGGLALSVVTLAPLRPEQKQSIYRFHAGLADNTDVDSLCEGLGTAFDLMIAGRLHGQAERVPTRAELYDRYCRKMLPLHCLAVATLVLRDAARRMSADFVSSISLQAFERAAEALLRECREPLHVLDELRTCRLLQIEDEMVSFQHDLLKDYFFAEDLWRSFTDIARLSRELGKPTNLPLVEFILPKCTSSSDIRQLLRSVTGGGLLLGLFRGKAGERAKEVLRQECDDLIDDAIEDLQNLDLTYEITESDDGKRAVRSVLLTGPRQWSAHDARLCDLLAQSLDDEHFCQRFLSLLDLTEKTLKTRNEEAARGHGVGKRRAWAEIIREYTGLLVRSEPRLPLDRIMATMRWRISFERDRDFGVLLRQGLVERATSKPYSDFAMALLLELLRLPKPTHVDLCIDLLDIVAKDRIYIQWVRAVEMIQCCASHVMEKQPEARARIVQILEGMLSEVSIDTIGILEALSCYEAIDPPVSFEGACEEFRQAAQGELSQEDSSLLHQLQPKKSADQFLADRAYGLVGQIFEDIFQGAYWQAYNSLDEDEKIRLLCRAAMATDSGFHIAWILEELVAKGNPAAAPVYQRFASFVDKDSPFRQDAVGALILGTAGWATVSAEPCRLEGPDTPSLRAWGLVAQMLFWVFRLGPTLSKERIRPLWECLNNEAAAASANVFYELSRSGGISELRSDVHGKLMRLFPDEARKMLEASIVYREYLTSIFRPWQGRDTEVLIFVIESLAEFGNQRSVDLLKGLVSDAQVGAAAIAAIKSLRNQNKSIKS
jgi:Nuclease-related domain